MKTAIGILRERQDLITSWYHYIDSADTYGERQMREREREHHLYPYLETLSQECTQKCESKT